jgi:hypothetical protein
MTVIKIYSKVGIWPAAYSNPQRLQTKAIPPLMKLDTLESWREKGGSGARARWLVLLIRIFASSSVSRIWRNGRKLCLEFRPAWPGSGFGAVATVFIVSGVLDALLYTALITLAIVWGVLPARINHSCCSTRNRNTRFGNRRAPEYLRATRPTPRLS